MTTSISGKPQMDFTTRISTFNFLLLFVGYPITTILFTSGATGLSLDSQTVTIPYRVFALVIAIITLVLNFGSRPRINAKLFLLFLYWALFIIRAFYDLEIQNAISGNIYNTDLRAWAYVLLINLFSAVVVLKSFERIDFKKALNWIVWFGTGGLLASLYGNEAMLSASQDVTARIDYGQILNTISYGHFGGVVAIAGFCALIDKERGWWGKVLLLPVILLGGFVLLRAGSRGPFLALMVAAIAWGASRTRYWVVNGMLLGMLLAIVFSFYESILVLVGKISPVLQSRFEASLSEGDTSGREFDVHWGYFLDNIWTGTRSELLGYAHNIIIDAFKGTGVFGGMLMVSILGMGVLTAFRFAAKQHVLLWVGLILIQQITAHMTSGCFSDNPLLSALLVVVFLAERNSISFPKNQ